MVITVGQVHEHANICQPVLRIHHNLGRIRIRGSMPPSNGSGPDPAISVIGLQDANKFKFFCLFLFEGTFTLFFKKKVKKKSQNSRNQGFACYFCLMIEGSGSVPLSKGSGSRRPKSIRIRWFRIRNTVANHPDYFLFHTFPLLMCFLWSLRLMNLL